MLFVQSEDASILGGFEGGNLSILGPLGGQVWVTFSPEEYPLKGIELGGHPGDFGEEILGKSGCFLNGFSSKESPLLGRF